MSIIKLQAESNDYILPAQPRVMAELPTDTLLQIHNELFAFAASNAGKFLAQLYSASYQLEYQELRDHLRVEVGGPLTNCINGRLDILEMLIANKVLDDVADEIQARSVEK